MARTPMLYIPETMLHAQKGVAVYSYDLDTGFTSLLSGYIPSQEAILYYQVTSIAAQGSWWSPTAASNFQPASWPSPVIDLEVWDLNIPTDYAGEAIVRPQSLFWWIEHQAMPQIPVKLGLRAGSLKGQFPHRIPLQRPPLG